ncbi:MULTISPECIES: hypothetical protein [Mesorhizobium]|uniref:Pentapeptide repeat-containing protein n=1 Tax=Mesorhizobium muleiense TaxID=1004279 RepID=A0A1G8V5X4_9HYPH|nr:MULTISPECIES: hypothetical protein [Mesorhizobium]MCF6102447.1 hypothetical protein [Mesorhizobium muleiense]RWC00619.1 MAG: hypothetical protein EOQ56_15185 [Mesorhizobium sp.]RWP59074.1 MAG: hypothetical protein EOR07_28035 [Mesorhizobium sp.]RWQ23314.1 MAG: hypothetical protein EOR92_04405 [Mesorhizobium sp.]SDJ60570.1 hypothetical protein SAMN05428953_107192 [Mesorhizobium muleiense]
MSEMVPFGVVALLLVCAFVCLRFLPDKFARRATDFCVHSEQAKILAAVSGAIAFVVVIATAYQIWTDLRDRATEREIRRDESIARAWDRLLRPAVGNTGKGEALTLLHKQGSRLVGIDLSCQTYGSWDNESAKCRKRPIIAGVTFALHEGRSDYMNVAAMTDADLKHTELQGWKIDKMAFSADFRNVVATDFTVVFGQLSGNFEGATISYSSILGSTLVIRPGEHPKMNKVNISGTRYGYLADTPFEEIFYWADWPPVRYVKFSPGLKDASGLTPDPYYGMQVLSKLTACAPPKENDGKVMPQNLRHLVTPPWRSCDRMSAEASQRRYPDAYAISHRTVRKLPKPPPI